jgi:hypothetical protein
MGPKHVVDTNGKIKTLETNTVANDGTAMLKWITERGCGVKWIHLAEHRDLW